MSKSRPLRMQTVRVRLLIASTVAILFLMFNYFIVLSQNGTTNLKGKTRQVLAAANRSVDAGEIVFKIDTDHDGISDEDELSNGLNPNNPADGDADNDGDGLSNGDEIALGTNPNAVDTDGDGASDADEVRLGFNPLDPASSPPAGATVVSIRVTPDSMALNINSILGAFPAPLTVTGVLSDGSTVDLTRVQGTTYQSQNAAVAIVDDTGTVVGLAPGTTSITAHNGNLSAQTSVRVAAFEVEPTGRLIISGASIQDVFVSGNYAYLAAGNAGLKIVDVHDRRAPFPAATLDTTGFARDVRVEANRAYVADGEAGLKIIDISNPTSPTLLGSVDTPGDAQDVVVLGAHAYVADSTGGLQIINVTNPQAPAIVGSFNTARAALGLDVGGQVAVVAEGGSGIQIINISTPASPQALGSLATTDARDVEIDGTIAYVADAAGSLRVVSIATPSSPQLLGSTVESIGGNLLEVEKVRDYVLGADTFSFRTAVPIIDVRVAASPFVRGYVSFSVFERGSSIAADGRFVYVTTPSNTLNIGEYFRPDDIRGIAPTIAITSLENGQTVMEGSQLNIVADASDDAMVTEVKFIMDGQVISTDTVLPYRDNTHTVPLGANALTLGATATDQAGYVGTAPAITLNVITDPPPTVAITSPPSGVTQIGEFVTISADANDNVAVDRVVFSVNGEIQFEDTTAPYTFPYRPSPTVTSLTIEARAIDNLGRSTTDTRTVAFIYNEPPRVTVTPSEGAILTAGFTHNIVANVTDDGQITQVDFYQIISGTETLLATLTAPPYSVEAPIAFNDSGQKVFKVVATDNFQTRTTVVRTVEVTPDAPPTIFITGPAEGTQLIEGQPFAASAFAQDNRHVSQVQFFLNGVAAPPITLTPYIQTLNVPVGITSLTLEGTATDMFGQTATATRTFTVVPNQPPTVTITSPVEGAQLFDGDTIEITADADDDVGVTRVVFTINDGDELTVFDEPFSVPFTIPVGATSLTITATAFDNLDRTATDTRTFEVLPNPANQAPIVTLVNPPAGTQWIEGQTVELEVDASGRNDLEIDEVVFTVNGLPLLTDRRAPYRRSFTVPLGVTSLDILATATDTAGQSTTASRSVSVVADTLTAVRGRVVDRQGNPVAGATASARLNGLKAEFFNFDSPITSMPDLTGRTPDAVKLVSAIDFRNPNDLFNTDTFGVGLSPHFAVRFTGMLEPGQGLYTFILGADDGARLKIDGNVIAEVIGNGEFTESQGMFQFDIGLPILPIEIDYFQNDGDAELQLSIIDEGIFGFASRANFASRRNFAFSNSIPFAERIILPQWALTISPDAFTAVTEADGTFTLSNIPAALGQFTVAAKATIGSRKVAGHVNGVSPVRGGIVDLGDITVKPAVGYYDLWRFGGNDSQVAPIIAAGLEPINVGNIGRADLSEFDILFIQNSDSFGYPNTYLDNLQKVHDFVSAGGVLIFHDRFVDEASTILPGNPGIITSERTNAFNINIADNTTRVTNGPGGVLTDATLDFPDDGFYFSSVGFINASSIPPGARGILSRSNPAELVLYAYPHGQGWVVYSTIPLDIYLSGFEPEEVSANFRDIYAPNVLGYADDLRQSIGGMALSFGGTRSGGSAPLFKPTPGRKLSNKRHK